MRIYEWQLCSVILLAMAILQDAYLFDCESLKPLKDCPKHNSSMWKRRAECKNCHGNLTYHCCKDYDSPKLNCPQDDFYCKEEIFVDGCAEEIFCKEGEEPILNFIKNQERVETPELFCEPCYNNNRYNDFKNKSSATFSECPYRKENICTQETHKIECSDPASVTSDRMCRCDSENGYSPDLHSDDHPIDGCSTTDYTCVTGKCGPNEKVLLNYTCECKEGFRRNNVSNECVSDHTTSSSTSMQTKKTTTTVENSTRPKQATTETFSISPTTSNHSTMKPKKPNDGSRRSYDIIVILTVISVLVVIVIIGGIILIVYLKSKKRKSEKKKNGIGERSSRTIDDSVNTGNAQHDTPLLPLAQRVDITDVFDEYDSKEVPFIQSTGDKEQATPMIEYPENNEQRNNVMNDEEVSQEIRKLQASASTLHLSNYSKGSQSTFTCSRGELIDLPFTRYQDPSQPTATYSLDRRRPSKSYKDDIKTNKPKVVETSISEDLVKCILRKCRGYMIEHLDPILVLDEFEKEGSMLCTAIRDIKELGNTSDRIRDILDKIRMNYTLYEHFKRSLKASNQTVCYDQLVKLEELLSYEKESGIEDDNRSPLQRRRHTFSTSSTGFELKQNSVSSNDSNGYNENVHVEAFDGYNDTALISYDND